MPIFSYKCNSCGHIFDDFSGNRNKDNSQENEEIKCPSCFSNDVKKNYSSFGFNVINKNSSSCGGGGCCSCG